MYVAHFRKTIAARDLHTGAVGPMCCKLRTIRSRFELIYTRNPCSTDTKKTHTDAPIVQMIPVLRTTSGVQNTSRRERFSSRELAIWASRLGTSMSFRLSWLDRCCCVGNSEGSGAIPLASIVTTKKVIKTVRDNQSLKKLTKALNHGYMSYTTYSSEVHYNTVLTQATCRMCTAVDQEL